MDAEASPDKLLNNGPNQYHAYLAYCQSEEDDRNKMEEIKLILNLEGLTTYPFTENKKSDIDHGILRSRKVLVIASLKYFESSWCTYEVTVIRNKILSLSEGTVHIIFMPGMERRRLPNDLQSCRYLVHNDHEFATKLCSEVKAGR